MLKKSKFASTKNVKLSTNQDQHLDTDTEPQISKSRKQRSRSKIALPEPVQEQSGSNSTNTTPPSKQPKPRGRPPRGKSSQAGLQRQSPMSEDIIQQPAAVLSQQSTPNETTTPIKHYKGGRKRIIAEDQVIEESNVTPHPKPQPQGRRGRKSKPQQTNQQVEQTIIQQVQEPIPRSNEVSDHEEEKKNELSSSSRSVTPSKLKFAPFSIKRDQTNNSNQFTDNCQVRSSNHQNNCNNHSVALSINHQEGLLQQQHTQQNHDLKQTQYSQSMTADHEVLMNGMRGRRLRKLMLDNKSGVEGGQHQHKFGSAFHNHMMRKKEIVEDPEVVQERNELIERRCCICLDEMKAKTKPEECVHVFCRTCITAWTKTFSNLCPLCKVEIKWLLIYKEKLDPEDEGFEEAMQEEEDSQQDQIVDRIEVLKPVLNNGISDFLEEFAENCYVCNTNENDNQLLICDMCNFNICHTYCCGLNAIPEGDWFCRDCTVIRQEQERRRQQRKERQKRARLLQSKKKHQQEEVDSDYEARSEEEEENITDLLKQQSDLYNQSEDEDSVRFTRSNMPSSRLLRRTAVVDSRGQQKRSRFATSIPQPPSRTNHSSRNSFERSRSKHQQRKDCDREELKQTSRGSKQKKRGERGSSLEEEKHQLQGSTESTPHKRQRSKSQAPNKQRKNKDNTAAEDIEIFSHSSQRVSQQAQINAKVGRISDFVQKEATHRIPAQQPLLNAVLPKFKTSQFGNRITMNFQDPNKLPEHFIPELGMSIQQLSRLEGNGLKMINEDQRRSILKKQQESRSPFTNPANAPAAFTNPKQSPNKSSLQDSINRLYQRPSAHREHESFQDIQQAPKKKGISFKDPTPQKDAFKSSYYQVPYKFQSEFDLLEQEFNNSRPQFSIQAGTQSASKAAYNSIIQESKLISNMSNHYRIKPTTHPTVHQKQQHSYNQNNGFSDSHIQQSPREPKSSKGSKTPRVIKSSNLENENKLLKKRTQKQKSKPSFINDEPELQQSSDEDENSEQTNAMIMRESKTPRVALPQSRRFTVKNKRQFQDNNEEQEESKEQNFQKKPQKRVKRS